MIIDDILNKNLIEYFLVYSFFSTKERLGIFGANELIISIQAARHKLIKTSLVNFVEGNYNVIRKKYETANDLYKKSFDSCIDSSDVLAEIIFTYEKIIEGIEVDFKEEAYKYSIQVYQDSLKYFKNIFVKRENKTPN